MQKLYKKLRALKLERLNEFLDNEEELETDIDYSDDKNDNFILKKFNRNIKKEK